jgi:hypothetical protein
LIRIEITAAAYAAYTLSLYASVCMPARPRHVRFGVSAPSVSRWWALERTQGDAAPKPAGGDRRSRETEALTLEELRAELAKDGVFVSYGALWRFLDRHKMTRKKRPRTPVPDSQADDLSPARRCPCSGGRMIIVETFEGVRPARQRPPGRIRIDTS